MATSKYKGTKKAAKKPSRKNLAADSPVTVGGGGGGTIKRLNKIVTVHFVYLGLGVPPFQQDPKNPDRFILRQSQLTFLTVNNGTHLTIATKVLIKYLGGAGNVTVENLGADVALTFKKIDFVNVGGIYFGAGLELKSYKIDNKSTTNVKPDDVIVIHTT